MRSGREIFYGKGAGMMPTASAVRLGRRGCGRRRLVTGAPSNVRLIAVIRTAARHSYRWRTSGCATTSGFMIKDQSGVLARISTALAEGRHLHPVGPPDSGNADGDFVPLIIMTHEAREGDMQRAMR